MELLNDDSSSDMSAKEIMRQWEQRGKNPLSAQHRHLGTKAGPPLRRTSVMHRRSQRLIATRSHMPAKHHSDM